MPIPRTTSLTAFDFTEQEMKQATTIPELTLMLIQTLAAEALLKRLSLKVDLTKSRDEAVTEFIQQEAALKGEQEAYEHLIFLARK
jgi:hypothetical protein